MRWGSGRSLDGRVFWLLLVTWSSIVFLRCNDRIKVDILAVELRDRVADLARELGLKIGCERHGGGEMDVIWI